MLWLGDVRASAEPTNDFWFNSVPMRGASGRISSDTAIQIANVYKCVRVVAETIGHLPLILYRRLPGGGKERAVTHPLYAVMAMRPNGLQTAMDWRMQMQAHIELRGNAYSRIEFRGAQVANLWPLHPDNVKVEYLPDVRRLRYTVQERGGKPETLNQDEVLHLRSLALDGYMGLNPVEAQRSALGLTWETEQFAARFYKNDATPGGWIEHPNNFKDKEAREKFRQSWREQQAGANRGSTAVLEYGLKYHEVAMKLVDAQFMETRKYQATDVAGLWRVPPHKIGILDQAKFANIEQQSIDWVTDGVLPRVRALEQRYSAELLSESEQREYFFEFLLEGLLRGDAAARAAFYKAGINDGWMTRNEARESENRNPLDGLDTPLQPLNMTDGTTGSGRPAKGARQASMERAAAEAVVQKESNSLRALKLSGQLAADVDAVTALYVRELMPFAARAFGVEIGSLDCYRQFAIEGALDASCDDRLAAYLTLTRENRITKLLECLDD